jgi:hypothetical protein
MANESPIALFMQLKHSRVALINGDLDFHSRVTSFAIQGWICIEKSFTVIFYNLTRFSLLVIQDDFCLQLRLLVCF